MGAYTRLELTDIVSFIMNGKESINKDLIYVPRKRKKLFGLIPVTEYEYIKDINTGKRYEVEGNARYFNKPFQIRWNEYLVRREEDILENGVGYSLRNALFIKVNTKKKTEVYFFDNPKDFDIFYEKFKELLPKGISFVDQQTGKLIEL